MTELTIYERAGGQEFFDALVAAFYRGVQEDSLLLPMYPEDLTDAHSHLSLFLSQYFGGPRDYEATRGHPRLRMRHAEFRITKRARDAWLLHMCAALEEVGQLLAVDDRAEISEYFEMAARQLRNV